MFLDYCILLIDIVEEGMMEPWVLLIDLKMTRFLLVTLTDPLHYYLVIAFLLSDFRSDLKKHKGISDACGWMEAEISQSILIKFNLEHYVLPFLRLYQLSNIILFSVMICLIYENYISFGKITFCFLTPFCVIRFVIISQVVWGWTWLITKVPFR